MRFVGDTSHNQSAKKLGGVEDEQCSSSIAHNSSLTTVVVALVVGMVSQMTSDMNKGAGIHQGGRSKVQIGQTNVNFFNFKPNMC